MSTTDGGAVERVRTTDGGGVVPPSVTDGNVVPRSVTNQNADFMERAHTYWAEHWHGSLSFREHLAAFAAQECAALEAECARLRELLRKHQWDATDMMSGKHFCCECGRLEVLGHTKGCRIQVALAATAPQENR